MAYQFKVDHDRRIVWIRGSGEIGRVGYSEGFQAVRGSRGVDESYGLHLDLRSVTSTLSVGDAQALSHHFRSPRWEGRIAFLVSRPVHYYLGKLACALLGRVGVQIEVHTEWDKAARWVGGEVEEGLDIGGATPCATRV